MQKIVRIMLGLPSSSKSTWVREQLNAIQAHPIEVSGFVVCSADDYHINDSGVYEYKPENAA